MYCDTLDYSLSTVTGGFSTVSPRFLDYLAAPIAGSRPTKTRFQNAIATCLLRSISVVPMFVLLVVSDRAGPSRKPKCENPLGLEAGGGLGDAACSVRQIVIVVRPPSAQKSSADFFKPRDGSADENRKSRMTSQCGHGRGVVNGSGAGEREPIRIRLHDRLAPERC